MDDEEFEPDTADVWQSGLFSGYCLNCFNCLYATIFPMCALASAKTQFDGSDFMFNFFCFGTNVAVVRNYIRNGYGIRGRVGVSDFCISSLFYPCVITQLLNEGRFLSSQN